MKPTINWSYAKGSRLGNQLTQFASVYALAKDLDLGLFCPRIDGFPATNDFERKPTLTQNECEPLSARHFIDQCKAAAICLRGINITNGPESYLENVFNFQHRSHEIQHLLACDSSELSTYSFYKLKSAGYVRHVVDAIDSRDLVISLRLGDFVHKVMASKRWKDSVYTRYLGEEYFSLVLDNLDYGKLFITSDEPFHHLVRQFVKYDPIIVANDSPTKTLQFISKFQLIAISESTFSWWAAYLTPNAQVFFPISSRGLWGINNRWNRSLSRLKPKNKYYDLDQDLYLRVDDPRYVYVYQPSGEIFSYTDAPGRRYHTDFA